MLIILQYLLVDKSVNEDLGMMQKLLDYFQNITVPIDKIFKVSFHIAFNAIFRQYKSYYFHNSLLKITDCIWYSRIQ